MKKPRYTTYTYAAIIPMMRGTFTAYSISGELRISVPTAARIIEGMNRAGLARVEVVKHRRNAVKKLGALTSEGLQRIRTAGYASIAEDCYAQVARYNAWKVMQND